MEGIGIEKESRVVHKSAAPQAVLDPAVTHDTDLGIRSDFWRKRIWKGFKADDARALAHNRCDHLEVKREGITDLSAMMDTEWQIHLIKDRWTVIEEKHFPGKEEKGITPIRALK